MRTSYTGIVKKGRIHLRKGAVLPEGAQVIVVVADRLFSLEEQEQYLNSLSSAEWRKLFDEFTQRSHEQSAQVDIESVSDEELVTLIHEVRATY
ncbi:MAG: hypothetical protein U0401_08800 [Anaerolineae bacterium]